MMTALRYGPAAVDAALRALFSRRRRRRSDLDQAWRDIAIDRLSAEDLARATEQARSPESAA